MAYPAAPQAFAWLSAKDRTSVDSPAQVRLREIEAVSPNKVGQVLFYLYLCVGYFPVKVI